LEQSRLEFNVHASDQDFPTFYSVALRNMNYKKTLIDPILNRVHTITTYLFTVRFNIILLSIPISP